MGPAPLTTRVINLLKLELGEHNSRRVRWFVTCQEVTNCDLESVLHVSSVHFCKL